MPLFVKVRSLLRNLFSFRRVEVDLDQEVHSHLEMLIEENIRAGMPPEEAQRAARIELGGIEQVKEQVREERIGNWLRSVISDCRYGVRQLRKNPGFTSVAVLTLALGIGANTAIFTLLHASLWRPLPISAPQQIFHIMRASSSGDFAGEFSCSYPLFENFSKIARPRGEVFAKSEARVRKFGIDVLSNERVAGEAVSANFFSVLSVDPILGRVFEPQDDSVLGGNRVAVLSHAFWVRRFRSDTSILGKTVFYDETPYTVVGVAQPGFSGIDAEISIDAWVPLTTSVEKRSLAEPDVNWLKLFIRLHPGVDPPQTESMFEASFRAYVADTLLPTASPRWKAMLEAQHMTLRPAASGLATTGRKYEKPLLVLLGVVALVLLISCANLANLVLARNAARQQEIMVRLALGASRTRIASQLFTESLLLAVFGAVCGIVVAAWGTRLLVSLLPQSPLPLAFDLRPDFVVLGFATAIAAGTAVLFGLLPALRMCRAKTELGLVSGQRIATTSFSGRFLVTGQLALSLPLLLGAGLFVGTLRNLKTSDLGFRPENVITFDLSFPKETSKDHLRLADAQIKERLESHPGVIMAAYAWPSVYEHGGWSGRIEVPGALGEDNDVGMISVSPGFFESVGLGLLKGRYFNIQDQGEKPPVVVVNESLAKYYFGTGPAIGQRIKLAGQPQILREIVGVVRDAKHYGVREKTWRMVYLPALEGGTFFVRSSLNQRLLSNIIQGEIAAVDKLAQVERIRPLEAAIDDMISQERLTAILSSAFAALAAALTAIGLYGVVAYNVSRRTKEFGIRMALGAQRGHVQALVLRQTAVPVLAGAVIGVAGALGLTRALSAVIAGMLYNVKPTDFAIFAGATLSLVAIALLAAFLPARRASRLDPMVALRYE
jgi:predicted permease